MAASGVTVNFSLSYPNPTDLITLSSDIENLATDVDTILSSSFVKKAGDTLTGGLSGTTVTLSGTIAASGLSGLLLSTANPIINGTAAAGTSAIPSRQDHVHPTDTSRLASSAYTAADVLSKLLTVDGTTSGLDADLLDGQHATAFAAAAHNHDASYQPIDGDLTSIAGLSGTTGILRKTGVNTWVLDTSTYTGGNENITLTGDITGSGTTAITTTLSSTGVSAGSYGSTTEAVTFTVDAKGRLSAASEAAIVLPQSSITGLVTALAGKLSTAGGTLTGALTLPADPTSNMHAATKQYVDVEVASVGGGGAIARPLAILVASAQAPASVKAVADYVCDGTNDQVEINAAIAAAAAQPATVTSPSSLGGYGKVELSAGRFWIQSPILIRTGVWLHGQYWLTELFAVALGGAGVVQFFDNNVHGTKLSDLFINGNSSSGNAHCVYYYSAGGDFSGRPNNSPDGVNYIENLNIWNTQSGRHGIWLAGTSGGPRGSHVYNVRAFAINGRCFFTDGASDCHFLGCQGASDGAYDVYYIGGGNNELTGCKAFYGEQNGFYLASSRPSVTNCIAQDNGNYGFYVASSDASIVGGQADSNGRTNANGGGVYIGSACTISGLTIFDRGQTASSPQDRGIVVGAAYNPCNIVASVKVPSGGTHVVNPTNLSSDNNFVAITRNGTTPIRYG